jgi:hypothetical protein
VFGVFRTMNGSVDYGMALWFMDGTVFRGTCWMLPGAWDDFVMHGREGDLSGQAISRSYEYTYCG